MPTSHQPITVFSGGSAANSLSDIFSTLSTSKSCPLAYVIPISDNGGSSSELIRVFGGPGIGDVRSRLVRLIPKLSKSSPGWKEREGIKSLFSHRLSGNDARAARTGWNDVVDGTSILWKDISSAKKELIRSILNLVNLEILKRSRPPSSTFDFTSASVGNLFLTGARLFTGSFESAIYLMGSICGINDEDVKVVPSINSNFSHHIAAGLEDGTVIVGQNSISHPSPPTPTTVVVVKERNGKVTFAKTTDLLLGGSNAGDTSAGYDERRASADHYYGDEEGSSQQEAEEKEQEEDAHLPGTLPTLRTRNITFNKHQNEELPARISRIWYINPYGQEILPPANPRAVAAINNAQAIIYSIGSLYTSLVPSLILKGVGDAIRKPAVINGPRLRTKILILNGSLDREVGPQPRDGGRQFSALNFVEAIVRAGEQSRGVVWEGSGNMTESLMKQPLTSNKISSNSIESRPVLRTTKSDALTSTLTFRTTAQVLHTFPAPLPASTAPSRDSSPVPAMSNKSSFTNLSASEASEMSATHNVPSKIDPIYTQYVTHVIHLPNTPSTPFVDRDLLLSKCGIQTVKVYGRKDESDEGGMRYDPAALRGAIEAILGRNPEKKTTTKSKRTGDSNDNGNEEDTEDDEFEETELSRKRTRGEEERRRTKGALAVARRNTLDSYEPTR